MKPLPGCIIPALSENLFILIFIFLSRFCLKFEFRTNDTVQTPGPPAIPLKSGRDVICHHSGWCSYTATSPVEAAAMIPHSDRPAEPFFL
ncbi:hypothetical protein [Komagataeibacter sp. FNDCF1]|uniref:hypothetical protein n=1 Tax=Komagataeibacter sp. FNDCF1 TaxID=2878681 RepID=UPI001E440497|nr:hypothetical protein [Komagataeibacter sp. FNDCF1]MCE2564067.1 hypothetical protein [Komagataeibacter sp. FNDCF1]